MRPLQRKGGNATRSTFKRNASRTKHANIAPPPNRGGYRF